MQICRNSSKVTTSSTRFFEFILAGDVIVSDICDTLTSTKYQDILNINEGDHIKAMNQAFMKPEYSIVTTWENIAHSYECNFGTQETYCNQEILMNKMKKYGIETYGIESTRAFKDFHSYPSINNVSNRCPYLNIDATDIIDKKLKENKGNALLVSGNAHFVDYDQTKGMQTLLVEKGYNCPTVLLTTKNVMNIGGRKYSQNNIDELMKNVVETQEDFHARVNELSAATRKEECSGILSYNFANQSQQKLGSATFEIQELDSNQRNIHNDWQGEQGDEKPLKKESWFSKSKVHPGL